MKPMKWLVVVTTGTIVDPGPYLIDSQLGVRNYSIDQLDDCEWRREIRGTSVVGCVLSDLLPDAPLTEERLRLEQPAFYATLRNAMELSGGKFIHLGQPTRLALAG